MLPLAKPAILVVMLFTLVWTWNDTLLPGLVINDTSAYTLGQRMENYAQLFTQARHSSAKTWSTSGEIGENVLMSVTPVGHSSPADRLHLYAALFYSEHRSYRAG